MHDPFLRIHIQRQQEKYLFSVKLKPYSDTGSFQSRLKFEGIYCQQQK